MSSDRRWYAPDNRTCKTCRHFMPGDPAEPDVGYPGCGPSCGVGAERFAAEEPVTHCQEWEHDDA